MDTLLILNENMFLHNREFNDFISKMISFFKFVAKTKGINKFLYKYMFIENKNFNKFIKRLVRNFNVESDTILHDKSIKLDMRLYDVSCTERYSDIKVRFSEYIDELNLDIKKKLIEQIKDYFIKYIDIIIDNHMMAIYQKDKLDEDIDRVIAEYNDKNLYKYRNIELIHNSDDEFANDVNDLLYSDIDAYETDDVYESDEYESDEYESDEYESDEYESDEYEPDEYESDEYEPDEYESDEYEPDESDVNSYYY